MVAAPLDALPLLLVIAGIGLSIAEALAPGAHFIVLGVALLLAGLLGLVLGPFVPLLATPLALAALVLAIGGGTLWVYREFDFYGGKGIARTTDASRLTGQTGRVTERVTRDAGEIKLTGGGFNPYYAARTIDGEIPVGAEVVVIDPGGGNVLTVESLDAVEEDEIDRELARERARRERSTEQEPA